MLGNSSHHVKDHLGVTIKGRKLLLVKYNLYIVSFQLVNNVLRNNSISCKTGYRLNQYDVNLPSVEPALK